MLTNHPYAGRTAIHKVTLRNKFETINKQFARKVYDSEEIKNMKQVRLMLFFGTKYSLV